MQPSLMSVCANYGRWVLRRSRPWFLSDSGIQFGHACFFDELQAVAKADETHGLPEWLNKNVRQVRRRE
jgi:hypothetical protein